MQYLFVILFLTTAAVDLFLAVWCYKHPGERRKVLGHQVGDELLKVLSHELQHAAEPEGICGRVGGDEFAALLSFPPDISEKAMYDRAEEIRRQIIKSMNDTWTVSMGAVSTRKKVRTIAELYKIADTALYTSKNQGKNQLHCVFQ